MQLAVTPDCAGYYLASIFHGRECSLKLSVVIVLWGVYRFTTKQAISSVLFVLCNTMISFHSLAILVRNDYSLPPMLLTSDESVCVVMEPYLSLNCLDFKLCSVERSLNIISSLIFQPSKISWYMDRARLDERVQLSQDVGWESLDNGLLFVENIHCEPRTPSQAAHWSLSLSSE